MKARYHSTFEYGKNLVKYIMIAIVVLAVVAWLYVPDKSPAQTILIIASFVLIAAAIAVMYVYCRCPYCGKRIMFGVMAVKACPACHRSLETGRKVKKNG